MVLNFGGPGNSGGGPSCSSICIGFISVCGPSVCWACVVSSYSVKSKLLCSWAWAVSSSMAYSLMFSPSCKCCVLSVPVYIRFVISKKIA